MSGVRARLLNLPPPPVSANQARTGSSAGSKTGQDYLTIKYDSSGQQLWASTYSSAGNNWDEGRSIGLDGSGNVWVTNSGNNSVSEFIGLAAPTSVPALCLKEGHSVSCLP